MVKLTCKHCGKSFQNYPSNKRAFCSSACYVEWQRETGRNLPGTFKVGHRRGFSKNCIPWNKGKSNWGVTVVCGYCGKNFRIKKYRLRISKKVFCSTRCWGKFRNKGASDFWTKLKTSKEYKLWRTQVFGRDNYTCQKCGARCNRLVVHHILPKSVGLENVLNVGNGMTLCRECHKLTDSYGRIKKYLEMNKIKLIESVRIIRQELLIKDEPIKAYLLLKRLNLPELQKELDKTYGMVRHLYEPGLYRTIYANDVLGDGPEKIEPAMYAAKAESIYPRYQWVLQELAVTAAKSYLDLACYVGSLVITAATRGIEAVGVDQTTRAVEIAQERAEGCGIKARFINADLHNFNEGKYDAVSALEVLEHTPDPEKTIKHMLSLTTENGWCFLTTPNGPFGNGEGNIGHWEYDGEHTRGHVRVFVKRSLEKLIKDCGGEIGFLEAQPDGLLWAKFRKGV